MRDPLWLLARQWQLGEYQGNDSGSPVDATISVQSPPLGLTLIIEQMFDNLWG